MEFSFSSYGQKFVGDCGILQLMEDLGRAVSDPNAIFLGGGNPSYIPPVQAYFRQQMTQVMAADDAFERMVGNYAPPAGDGAFLEALAALFRRNYGWEITAENIALTAGSQTAFHLLFNLFAGRCEDGKFRKILLPLSPEYIGYADVGIDDGIFTSVRPIIDLLPDNQFKYRVDFDALTMSDDIGAIAVSRPTNPTGNVLTDDEVTQLSALARDNGIPLILDNAYGLPFPGIIFRDAQPIWDEHVILCMSLSKLGLPGIRTGIVVADKQVIAALRGMNAVISLSPNNVGSALLQHAVESDQLLTVSQTHIRPHYQKQVTQTVQWLADAFDDVPYRVHKPEGAIFVWLWFEQMQQSSAVLYQKLLENNVIVVPGHYFFPGLENDDWAHKQQCIRVSYAQSAAAVQRGISIIAEQVRLMS